MKFLTAVALIAALAFPASAQVPMTGAGLAKPAAGGGGGPTQVRVTFQASSSGAMILDHVSIGIKAGAGDAYDTAATPVELLFSGVSGFNISSSASITSDWATLVVSTTIGMVYTRTLNGEENGWPGYSLRGLHSVTGGATPVVVIMDIKSTGDWLRYVDGGSGDSAYYKAATASYATADVTGFSGPYGTSRNYSITSIETQ